MKSLSKSKFITGLRCPKYLWLDTHQKDLAVVDESTELGFKYGKIVEKMGRTLFKGGILVDALPWEIKEASAATLIFLNQGQKVIYEACALTDDFKHARIDVLEINKDGSVDLNEIKSAMSVKDYHVRDLAFQTHIFREAGFKVRKSRLIHVNPDFVKNGEIDPGEFLMIEDLTSQMDDMIATEVLPNIDTIRDVMEQKSCPETEVGSHCTAGWECPYYAHCHKDEPEHYNVRHLFSGGKLADLLGMGIEELADVPVNTQMTHRQSVIVHAHKTKEVYIEKEPLQTWIDTLEYPLRFFDFETVAPLIPLWDGTSPKQMLSVQWSCHTIEKPGAEPFHTEFLSEKRDDPREELIVSMLEALGTSGTILAWYKSFEIGRIEELAEQFPKYKKELLALIPRIDDLIDPFKEFWFHHPDQNGSNSLKAVYPALVGDAYDHLDINNGKDATQQYQLFLEGELDNSILKSLLHYCRLDTYSMIEILSRLKSYCELK